MHGDRAKRPYRSNRRNGQRATKRTAGRNAAEGDATSYNYYQYPYPYANHAGPSSITLEQQDDPWQWQYRIQQQQQQEEEDTQALNLAQLEEDAAYCVSDDSDAAGDALDELGGGIGGGGAADPYDELQRELAQKEAQRRRLLRQEEQRRSILLSATSLLHGNSSVRRAHNYHASSASYLLQDLPIAAQQQQHPSSSSDAGAGGGGEGAPSSSSSIACETCRGKKSKCFMTAEQTAMLFASAGAPLPPGSRCERCERHNARCYVLLAEDPRTGELQPIRRKRGRPRKYPRPDEDEELGSGGGPADPYERARREALARMEAAAARSMGSVAAAAGTTPARKREEAQEHDQTPAAAQASSPHPLPREVSIQPAPAPPAPQHQPPAYVPRQRAAPPAAASRPAPRGADLPRVIDTTSSLFFPHWPPPRPALLASHARLVRGKAAARIRHATALVAPGAAALAAASAAAAGADGTDDALEQATRGAPFDPAAARALSSSADARGVQSGSTSGTGLPSLQINGQPVHGVRTPATASSAGPEAGARPTAGAASASASASAEAEAAAEPPSAARPPLILERLPVLDPYALLSEFCRAQPEFGAELVQAQDEALDAVTVERRFTQGLPACVLEAAPEAMLTRIEKAWVELCVEARCAMEISLADVVSLP